MEENRPSKIKTAFCRKIWVIFLVAILGAIALGVEKFFFSNFVTRTDIFYIANIVKVENFNNGMPASQMFVNQTNYKAIMLTTGNLYKFIQKGKQDRTVNFQKLNADWNKLSEGSQILWLSKIIKINDMHNGVYEIILNMDKFSAKDIDYLAKNAPQIMKTFVQCSNDFIKEIEPETKIKIIDQRSVVPEIVQLSKKKIVLKYAVIGFVLGGIVSSLAVALWALGKKNGI